VVLLWAQAAVAQQAPTASLNEITAVRVTGDAVEITCAARPNFTSLRLQSPPRLVLDFADTVLRDPPQAIAEDLQGLRALRTEAFRSETGAVARVVLTLAPDAQVGLRAAPGNTLKIQLRPDARAPAPSEPRLDFAQADTQAKAQAEARAAAQAQAEAEARAQAEARAKTEAEARAQAEARAKTEAEARAQAEAQARAATLAQARAEAAAQAAQAKLAKLEAERAAERARTDAAAKARADREAQAQAQALQAKQAAEARADAAKAQADAARAQADAARAQADAAKARADREARVAQAARDKQRAEAAALAAAQRAERDRLASEARARADAEQAERDRLAQQRQDDQARARAQAEAHAQVEARAEAEYLAAQRRAEQAARTAVGHAPPQPIAVATSVPAPPPAASPARPQPERHRPAAVAVRPGIKNISLVGFREMSGGGKVFIRANEAVAYAVSQPSPLRLQVVVKDARISQHNGVLPLNTRYFPGPVAMITPSEDRRDHTVKVEIQLKAPATYSARLDGNDVVLDFAEP